MLRAYIDHCLENRSRVHNLQRGTTRRRRWHLWKVHVTLDEMVMAIVRMGPGEHEQTMDRQAATVVFPEVIANVIAMIAGWRETVAAE